MWGKLYVNMNSAWVLELCGFFMYLLFIYLFFKNTKYFNTHGKREEYLKKKLTVK